MWLFWCQFSWIESERGRKDASLHLSHSSRLYHRAAAVCRQTTSPQTDPSFWQHANLEACDSDESQYLRRLAFYPFTPPRYQAEAECRLKLKGRVLACQCIKDSGLIASSGGFLSPFLPIVACGTVCISICYDEPWCQMVAFVCAHACVCTMRPLRRSLQLAAMNILMITTANNCRHESSRQTCWKQSSPINLSSLWGRFVSPSFVRFYPAPLESPLTLSCFTHYRNLVLEPKQ